MPALDDGVLGTSRRYVSDRAEAVPSWMRSLGYSKPVTRQCLVVAGKSLTIALAQVSTIVTIDVTLPRRGSLHQRNRYVSKVQHLRRDRAKKQA